MNLSAANWALWARRFIGQRISTAPHFEPPQNGPSTIDTSPWAASISCSSRPRSLICVCLGDPLWQKFFTVMILFLVARSKHAATPRRKSWPMSPITSPPCITWLTFPMRYWPWCVPRFMRMFASVRAQQAHKPFLANGEMSQSSQRFFVPSQWHPDQTRWNSTSVPLPALLDSALH